MQRLFSYFYAALLFLTPLILWPKTSEVFEFNKMLFVYAATTIITAVWAVKCILAGKIIFRRTLLDYPLMGLIGVNFLSTLLSIDPRTSWLGYYSRFNGGMLSILCYSLLYWGFVSNMDKKSALRSLYALLASAIVVSIYGILERFGIDKDVWVQDVQNRVFSTLGQPNWLAAFILALIPLTWATIKKPYSFILSALFFVTLLLTKSRSGLLGFFLADALFWGLTLLKEKSLVKEFLAHNFILLAIFLAIGNPFQATKIMPQDPSPGPALEQGGTESGTIRKIVWKGAFEIWRHYPILGTGPETFAFAYYNFRPREHNLVSEWDFIYNKAHNEYLNLAANTGTAGLISYLFLIFASIKVFIRTKRPEFLAGYAGLLVSNFFGFSVVPTQLILFLFPAFAQILNEKYT